MKGKAVVILALFLVALAGAAWAYDIGDTLLFRNGDREALVKLSGEEDLFLTIDEKTYHMKLTVAASGALYEAEGDRDTVFWNKGDTATIAIEGRNIPGEFELVQNASAEDTSSQPEATADGTNIPLGVKWTARSISGKPLVPGSAVTFCFDRGAALGGRASVNMYRSSWIATDDRMLIKVAASKRMAAPRDLMEQENQFLAMLEDVRGYEVRGDTLVLTTKDGMKIEARR